jgi:uncharacterized protein HemX
MIEREIRKCESKLGELQNFQSTTKSALSFKLDQLQEQIDGLRGSQDESEKEQS